MKYIILGDTSQYFCKLFLLKAFVEDSLLLLRVNPLVRQISHVCQEACFRSLKLLPSFGIWIHNESPRHSSPTHGWIPFPIFIKLLNCQRKCTLSVIALPIQFYFLTGKIVEKISFTPEYSIMMKNKL